MRTATLSLTLLAASAFGQDTNAHFEVASVRPAAPQSGITARLFRQDGAPGTGHISYTNVALKDLVIKAYGLDYWYYQLSEPDWLEQVKFDVVVKLDPASTPKQLEAMLQNLLAERFGMVVHHESRQLPMYELVVAKGGPKLKESAESAAPAPAPPPVSQGPPTPVFPVLKFNTDQDGLRQLAPGSGAALVMMSLGGAKARYSARQQPISELVRVMQSTLRHPVVDKTGLTGKYDFNLDFTQDGQTGATGPPPAADNPAELGPPDVFTAFQQQLGLKLEEKKGPVDVLVVDRVEKTPSEN
jgi:uncharacterized protein (TIGR03435 family)